MAKKLYTPFPPNPWESIDPTQAGVDAASAQGLDPAAADALTQYQSLASPPMPQYQSRMPASIPTPQPLPAQAAPQAGPAISMAHSQMARSPGAAIQSNVSAMENTDIMRKLQANQDALEGLQGQTMAALPAQKNLSPLLAMADLLNNGKTHMQQEYQAPMDAEGRAKLLLGYADKQQQGRQQLAEKILQGADSLASRQMMMGQLADQKVDKQFQALNDALDPDKGRAGNFAKMKQSLMAADKADAVFRQFPDYNVPANQTHELAQAVAQLVGSGSAQAQSQIDALVPHSAQGSLQQIESYIQGIPKGQEQQAFMKNMHDTVLREREVAANQLQQTMAMRLAGFDNLKRTDQGRYNRILDARDIDPSAFNEKGQYVPKFTALDYGGAPAPTGIASHPDLDAEMKRRGLK